MDKYVGKRLDGRYEIKEIIGVGGMSIVYKAYDSIDDRMVAVKILKEELLANEEFRRRFKNESKAIAVLSHPNIVKVYDVSFGDRLQYFVMEHIDGITLKEYLEKQKVIKWKEALHFVVQVLRALQHAHDKGIVHRDIKPQNIMLLADGTIKVTDFGIARFSRLEQRTLTDKAIGSVHYISPEQARGDVTDEKSDIYSVGVLLYEMLTGCLPFEADSAVSVAIMQLQSTPKMPRTINQEIPEGLEEITIKAMQKDPQKRYQSAAEMLSDIEAFKKNPSILFQYKYFVDDEPTKYIPTDGINKTLDENILTDIDEPAEKPVKRSPVVPILMGVTGAFIIGIIALAIFVTGPSVFGLWGKNSSDAVPCPNLIGLDYNTVINDPQYSQYTITLSNTANSYSSEYEYGIIMDQTPDAGKTIKGKKEIEVTVSLGSKQVEMQDLRNYSVATVTKTLEDLGLAYSIEDVYSDEVAQGFVVRTDPAGGSTVDENATVVIYVSKGAVPQYVTVVNYVGLTQEAAKRQIEDNGLSFGSTTYKESSEYPEGIVISQSVSVGSTVTKDTTVNLVVSSGKPILPVNINMPIPSNASKSFTLDVYYNGGSVYNITVDPTTIPGTSKTVNIQLTSDKFVPSNTTPTVMVKLSGYQYIEYKLNFEEGTYAKVKTYTIPDGVLSSTSSTQPSSVTSSAPNESSIPNEQSNQD